MNKVVSKWPPKAVQSSLRENCPYLGLFWSTFSRIRTKYGEIRSIFLDWIGLSWTKMLYYADKIVEKQSI